MPIEGNREGMEHGPAEDAAGAEHEREHEREHGREHERSVREAVKRNNKGIKNRWKMTLATVAGLLILMAVLMMTACETEQKTLEDYLVDSPSAQEEIEESLSGLNNGDMDVSVTYEGNKVNITCDMKTTYKKRVLKAMKRSYRKYLEKNLPDPMQSAVAAIEQDTGIAGVTIQVTINNGNGKKIWSEVYPVQTEEETEATEATDETTT